MLTEDRRTVVAGMMAVGALAAMTGAVHAAPCREQGPLLWARNCYEAYRKLGARSEPATFYVGRALVEADTRLRDAITYDRLFGIPVMITDRAVLAIVPNGSRAVMWAASAPDLSVYLPVAA